MIEIPLMILLGVFQTVEFYVIVSVVAAAALAVVALPERKGEVKTYLLAGELLSDDSCMATGPGNGELVFECHAGNIVTLRREGLAGVDLNGAVSLAVHVSGFDISIDERVTPGGYPSSGNATAAQFTLDFLAPEWYHIRYESERHAEHAALTLHVREGIVMRKKLIH